MEETITITRKEYDFLRSAIASLQEEIALLKNGKSSKTSHSAPSTDIGRSNSQSLRPVTDRKMGGQLGHVFPAHLKSSVQYGSSVASMVAYLSSYQYLPMQRIANLMQCAFGINMSVGTVKNMLSQMAAKALPTYGIIQQTLQASTMVGSDETGSKIAGKKG
jgi:hypothetical protein